MTTDPVERGFLRSIIEHPHADTPRLVYADWLDEYAGTVPCPEKGCGNPALGWNGFYRCRTCRGTGTVSNGRHERAELIRAQIRDLPAAERTYDDCLMRDLHHTDPEKANAAAELKRLRARQAELLAAHGREWARVPCPDCGGEPYCYSCGHTGDLMQRAVERSTGNYDHATPHFRRGFVSRVEVPALSWVMEYKRFVRHREPSPISFLREPEGGPIPPPPPLEEYYEWRVTPWALAVAGTHPVTEWRWFPDEGAAVFGTAYWVTENIAEFLGISPGPYTTPKERDDALAVAAADVVRAAVLEAWAKEART